MLAVEAQTLALFPPKIAQHRRANADQHKQAVLKLVDFLHQPIGVFRAISAQIHPHRHGNQRRQAVHHQKAQIRHFAADAGRDENRRAQAGQKAGHKQHAVAVFIKFFLHLRIALGRHHPRHKAGFQNAVAKHAPGGKHQPVANQHAQHAHRHHNMHIGIAQAGNHPAGHQGNVFRNRHAEAASHQHEENRGIPVLSEECF